MDNLLYLENYKNYLDDFYTDPVKEYAKKFLTLLDSEAPYFTFQTFDDNKKRKSSSLIRVFHGSLDEHWHELVELNGKGAGIFVTVNKTDLRGRKEKNIIGVRAIFQDDDESFQGTYPLPPSIQVQSSPGKFQRYWLCSDVSFEQFKDLQERLIESYGCDKNVKDLTRVFRLPGFFHRKDPDHPYLVRMVEPSPGIVYGAEELIKAFRRKTDLSQFWVKDLDAAEVASNDKVVRLKSPSQQPLDAEGIVYGPEKLMGAFLGEVDGASSTPPPSSKTRQARSTARACASLTQDISVNSAALERARTALSHVPADDREIWLKVGMALN